MARRADFKMPQSIRSCLRAPVPARVARKRRGGRIGQAGLTLLLSWALILPAAADTFKCIDANGRATYTNMKEETRGKNCTVVMREISVVPAMPAPRAATPPASPSGFPKVDPATQKTRDDGRRRILEDELNGEEKALAKSKTELAEQEGIRTGGERNYQRVLERLQPYKDEVERHQKNIEALKKELANMK
jgi:hypothetical protein